MNAKDAHKQALKVRAGDPSPALVARVTRSIMDASDRGEMQTALEVPLAGQSRLIELLRTNGFDAKVDTSDVLCITWEQP